MTPYEPKVKEFMLAFDQRCYPNLHSVPDKVLKFRASLVEEESKEYLSAKTDIDRLDALCDIVYVVAGSACVMAANLIRLPPESTRRTLTVHATVINNLREHLPCIRRLTSSMSECIRDCQSLALLITDNFDAAFDCVHDNNMAKLWKTRPTDSSLIVIPKKDRFLVKNKEGKVIKPMGFKPPDLGRFLKKECYEG